MIQVIYLKLGLRQKHRLLRLVILFDDLQLRLEFIIQQDAPLLRLLRMVLRNRYFEIIHRRIIVRGGRLTDDILSVRDRNGYRIALLIRKHLRAAVFRQDNRFCF